MGLPSGGPLERLRLDPAAQDSGMCPNCEAIRNFPSSRNDSHGRDASGGRD